MSPLDKATPRQLLELLAFTAYTLRQAQEKYNARPCGRAERKGRAGRIRTAKRKRIQARDRRLQRVTWCSYYEEEKRRARAEA